LYFSDGNCVVVSGRRHSAAQCGAVWWSCSRQSVAWGQQPFDFVDYCHCL